MRELGTGEADISPGDLLHHTLCCVPSPSTLNTACSEQLLDSPLQGSQGRKQFWLKLGRSRWHSAAGSDPALLGSSELAQPCGWAGAMGREHTRLVLVHSILGSCLPLQAGSRGGCRHVAAQVRFAGRAGTAGTPRGAPCRAEVTAGQGGREEQG